ncbi:IS1182 family transposase [Spirosoma sp.]|uniref:IS1182 family transposase n=1 Tax=Spirosoma sp. TaxID=1899569 RepID=UPI002618B7B4|nr:IS1182 family transposase [Spirosoma sp.]MCX6213810.1 IS1182 family transposase [Spirosoma sp.]
MIQTSLVKLVPAHHFYQQLLKAVDFRFVRPLFEPFYSTMGRPSLDPIVFIKLQLVAHLENITSDRKLLELANLHLGIRAFLGYALEQPLPWHSTLSRTRQRVPISVFEACFTHIIGLCIHKGLVSGHTQVIDSAYIKANASMSRLKRKPAIWSSETTSSLSKPNAPRLTASVDRLQHIHRFHKNIKKAAPNKTGQLFSNLTHYSPTDPDARIAFKTGKPRQLAYMTSVSVDAAQHVITHIQAGSADRRDSRNLLPIIDTTQERLREFGVAICNVVADAGYSSGENYEQLEIRGLTGFVSPHGKYKDERPGFHYDVKSDSYTCSQGKRLAFDKLLVDKQGNPKKRYLAKASDCKDCDLCEPCKGKKASEKRLHHTYYKAQYERMVERLSSRFGKRMMRIRSATVEPVLGSLINYYGLRQINTRSREAAAKVMYVAAMAYNLKKYLRFTSVEQSGMVIALPVPDQFYYILIYFCNSHPSYRTGLGNVQTNCGLEFAHFPDPFYNSYGCCTT